MRLVNEIKDIIRKITGEVPTKTLVRRGMKIGNDFNRQQGCYLDPTHPFLIEIGNNVTCSIRVTVMAHDASTKKALGYTKIGRVTIGDNVFVGANATILPGVRIGNNCIIGAASVVTNDIPENSVAVGNPAKVIYSVEDYKIKWGNPPHVFDESYRFGKKLTSKKIAEMREATKDGIAFIV